MSDITHRYLAALPRGDGQVFLSWRLLSADAADAAFNIERRNPGGQWQRVNSDGITDSTNFSETTPSPGSYEYRAIDPTGAPSEVVQIDSSSPASIVAREIPLNRDDRFEWCTVVLGDLCNNSRMGFVLRCVRGPTIWILAYSHEGELLWEIDTMLSREGGWGTLHVPYLAWDINGDGRTEVVFHASRKFTGSTDYTTATADEILLAVDGETGEKVWQVPWPAVHSRVMMTVAYLHGLDTHACVVVQDETYEHAGVHPVLIAIDGLAGKQLWRVDQQRGAGHNLDVADIDGDGVQEVICGGACYNGDGSLRWEAETFGHTDISKPARIDPSRDGMQIWYAVESDNPGVYLVDNQGQTIFKEPFNHAHYGWVARHTAKVPGLQPHTAEDARLEYGQEKADARTEGHFPIFLPDGSHWLNLTEFERKNFVPVHWDAGPEVVFAIRKENKRIVRLLESGEIEDIPDAKLPEAGEYGRNLACVDVMGDFRENIVTIDHERHSLVVLTNPTVCNVRGRSPCDDFEYRHDRSQLGSGYYIYLSPPVTIV